MSDTPDLQELARRYLDLWQEQATAVATDPALAEAMARAYALMIKGVATFAAATGVATHPPAAGGAASTSASGTSPSHERKADMPATAAPSGAPPAAAAPAGPGFDTAELVRRLAELEERVLRLETASAAGSRSAAPAPRRRRH